MYTLNDRYLDTNGYVLVYIPDHPKTIQSGSFKGYVYEHIVVAERLVDRPIMSGEVVHHLDKNRSNNSPDNLLVITGPMHSKLHTWMDKNTITPTKEYQERIDIGCVRCKVCSVPIDYGLTYCSHKCHNEANAKFDRPTKEALEQMVWEKPTSQIAKDFNVSDTAIAKLCKKLGVEKPGRGYWAKKIAEKVE